jgi:tripartite-type tricarboxylate transporter receptor subunit TctC
MTARVKEARMNNAFRALGLACALAIASWGAAQAQTSGPSSGYPDRAIHWILPGAPGSPPDLAARIVSERLATALGQPVVVENHPGASGTIALAAVARSAADGYTFGILSLPQIVAPAVLARVPYDTERDLRPVAQLVWVSNVLVVRSGMPARSVAELVAAAKAKPGEFTFASVGNGSLPHLAGELFRERAGIDIRHIPFKSGPYATAAIMGGQVDLYFGAPSNFAAGIRSGKVRALATPAHSRLERFPEVPTIAEAGFEGFEMRDWFVMAAPAGVPGTIIDRMAAEVRKIIAAPEVSRRLTSLSMEPVPDSTPEKARALVHSELQRWTAFVRAAGIHAD